MDQDFKTPLSIETRDSVTVVHFHKPVAESRHLAEIELQMTTLIQELDHPRLVIDFAEVTFFPSTGIGMIISSRNDVTKKHGVLGIASLPEMIEHMFTLTGLTKVIPVYDTVDEAVEALSQKSS